MIDGQHIIFAGAQKCGTGTLFQSIASHPEIAPAIHPFVGTVIKEVGFFDLMWHRGFDWYASFYPANAIRTIDASPNYLSDPIALARIGKVFPWAKLIVSIRNPVARALSHHNHYREMMPESSDWDWCLPGKSLAENVEAELNAPLQNWTGLLKRGLYAQQLSCLSDHVPRKNVLVLVMEEWTKAPDQTLHAICEFLECPPMTPTLKIRHRRPNKPPADAETLRILEDYYALPNKDLFEWLGREIDW